MGCFQSQLVRIFDKVRLDTRGSLGEAIAHLRSLGWKVEATVYPYSACYDSAWEHPAIAEFNRNHKSDYARDMLHHFFDLYVLHDDIESEYFAPFYLSVGRIGNTTDFLLTPPNEYVEDREDELAQTRLF